MPIFDTIAKRLRFRARDGLEIGPRHHRIKSVEQLVNGEIHISLDDFIVYFIEVDSEIEITTAMLFLGINPPKRHEIETTVNHLIRLIEKEVGLLRVKGILPLDQE